MNPNTLRNALLAVAGIFLLVAIILSPRLLSCFSSATGIFSLICIVIEGLLAAHSTKKLGFVFLRGITKPWYGQSMAPIFLLVALPCIGAIFSRIDDLILIIFNVNRFITQEARNFAFMSIQLLWIVILECPNNKNICNKEPNWRHLS